MNNSCISSVRASIQYSTRPVRARWAGRMIRRRVVDSHARVIGVRNLRVVDASALPILPPGHPVATICEFSCFRSLLAVCEGAMLTACCVDALAEKISDDVLRGE